tara:strand:- start:636 stop:743 length:108 start_codon:yes stop_codon:yes gene_type:complete
LLVEVVVELHPMVVEVVQVVIEDLVLGLLRYKDVH